MARRGCRIHTSLEPPRGGPGHRLSLCVGAGHTDGGHGGHERRRAARHPDQGRRAARDRAARDGRRLRQDGHAHAGQALLRLGDEILREVRHRRRPPPRETRAARAARRLLRHDRSAAAQGAVRGGREGVAGAGGKWGSNSVGVSTTRYVGINTSSAQEEYPLYVGATGLANTTVVAYFDGDISVAGTIFKDNIKNLDSIGFVTARSGINVGYDYDGGTGVGATILPSGNAVFAGVVTASTMFYPPVMTSTVRDAASVTVGALIFNTTTAQLEIYNGSAWVGVGGLNNLTITNL